MANHWLHVVVPLFALIAVVVIGLWARLAIRKFLKKPQAKTTRLQNTAVIETTWNTSLIWFVLLGVYLAIEISIIPQTVKKPTLESLASLFVISLMWAANRLSSRIIRFYIGKTEAMKSLTSIALNISRIIIIVIGLLILFDVWGIPTFPIILVLVAGLFIIVFVFRNTLDNLLAGFEIAYSEHIKIGHFIKLGSGETGHVTKISWTRTVVQMNDGFTVIIPNYKLMTTIIINHGSVMPESTKDISQTAAPATKPPQIPETLSDRELEVLKLIGAGATNREIAGKLIISENTVKSHVRSILNKLALRNRQQAAIYAERQGLSSLPKTEKDAPQLP
jgi:DNA-binding CsgD family transcriptional regulator